MTLATIEIGQKALVTTDGWFFAPDGRQYRAVFGTVKAVRTAEESLGVRPNGRSTNWYLQIGALTLAGCQVHYVLRCDECSTASHIPDFTTAPFVKFDRPTSIFHTD